MPSKKDLLLEKRRYNLPEVISQAEELKLKKGMPVQKIIGFIKFDDIQINLNHNILIPRYETEEVIHEALNYISPGDRVLDLCTGSGYIGLTIKSKVNATVIMSDISDEAIKQSTENALLNNLDVEIIKSNMFENIIGKFDVIVSNPPYVPSGNVLDSSVINFEPTNALFAGEDGNDFIRIIDREAKNYLKKKGILIIEVSNDNYNYLKQNGFTIKRDINGKNRIAIKVYN